MATVVRGSRIGPTRRRIEASALQLDSGVDGEDDALDDAVRDISSTAEPTRSPTRGK
jgi:hypothetical protein